MDKAFKIKQLVVLVTVFALSACAGSPDETVVSTPSTVVTTDTSSSLEDNIVAVDTSEASADDGYETDAELEAEIFAELEASDGEYNVSGVYDPLEGFNRAMWDINYNYLDPWLVRPVSLAYVEYTPSPLRSGIRNFLANLDEPASMVNSLLMQDGEKAVTHFNRFWINSTFGLFGLIDIASAADIRKPSEQVFGDSMGYYGVGNGPYFMVPFYGPITLREGAGDVVDGLYFPLNLLTFWQGLGKWAFEGMEDRAALVQQEALLNDSPDPYIFTRDAYIQNKNFRAQGNKSIDEEPVDEEYLDDFLDEVDG
ncbi:MlaA family lipoprotein [Photobacterium sanctipauli]|uniref:MlaA family lipoprotein n=1 Tax=Photobacterium sanctipauli TaxID=1342794 RepID=UPI000B184DCC|nr:MlaA family lipoprotein [Photobacterium sanctipauli]